MGKFKISEIKHILIDLNKIKNIDLSFMYILLNKIYFYFYCRILFNVDQLQYEKSL